MKSRYLTTTAEGGMLFLMVLAVTACGPSRAVTRTEATAVTDLSGRWNDTDSRLVSEEMIKDCLSRPWLAKFKEENEGKIPDVIVGKVLNRSHEHINVQTFTKDLERALLNSGEVNFVASSTERKEIRGERLDMAEHASDESMKGPGQEAGADFMLKGQMNSIMDEAGGQKVVYYQVELELIDVANNRKSWIGQKKIKKIIEKAAAGW